MDNNPYLTADFTKQQKQEVIINVCFIVIGYLLINFNAKAAQYMNAQSDQVSTTSSTHP